MTNCRRGMPANNPNTVKSSDRQGRILAVFMTGTYMDTAHPIARAAVK